MLGLPVGVFALSCLQAGTTADSLCCAVSLSCRSVLWGRSVFTSIRKFLQFQLTVNFVALVVSVVGALVGGRMPLNVLQVRAALS